ncbi:MAG: ABC transporter permease [Candidatus Bipolaricaulis sp.]|nr:ABC transporter permease [Candidatus Bipolaricaulis sp.]
MLRYVVKRLLLYIPTLLGVLAVVFILTHVVGDPSVLLIQPGASREDLEHMREILGLDRPIWEQFWVFLRQALQGDFGTSFWSDRAAMSIVMERLPATAELAFASLLVALVLGIPAAILAALKRNSFLDLSISTLSLFGISMPSFWLGLMMMLVFGVWLQWLPISGRGGFDHLILPAVTLGVSMMAIVERLLRTDLLDVLSEDYVRTAAAKGLTTRRVVLKHALKNALIPTVTMIGMQLGGLLGGAVVTETVFGWPGLGRLVVKSIADRDYPVVHCAVWILAVVFISINLVVDLLYGILDPRIRYD